MKRKGVSARPRRKRTASQKEWGKTGFKRELSFLQNSREKDSSWELWRKNKDPGGAE